MSGAAEELRAAVDWLITRGWCQFAFATGPEGACCALGALHKVTARGFFSTQDSLAATALRAVVGDRVTAWNDTMGRTRADVVRAMLEAAARLDGK